MRLENKVCIITGAALGIGRASALLFAKEGAKVVAADLLTEEGQQTVNLIKAAGGEAAFCAADVSNEEDVSNMVKFTIDRYGKVDVLFCNAGILMHGKDGMTTDITEETWDKTLDINAKGPYLCCKHVLPEMAKGGGGSVVMNASHSALVGIEAPAYCASKGALVAFSRVVARHYAKKNVRCNAICPGAVETRIREAGKAFRAKTPPQIPAQDNLLGRDGRPEEIANLALFLASDESSFITGATYLIDGGLTAL